MIRKFSYALTEANDAAFIKYARRVTGLEDLRVYRAHYIEFLTDVDSRAVTQIVEFLSQGDYKVEVDRALGSDSVQVAYKVGVTDNEHAALQFVAICLGLPIVASKSASIYSSSDPTLFNRAEKELYNPTIQDLHVVEPWYTSLKPQGEYIAPQTYDLLQFDDHALAALGKADGRNLSLHKMKAVQRIQAQLNAPAVTDVLLEAMDARWSDHCYHTTWREHGDLLGRLRYASEDTKNLNILSMFHDNAGVWDFYEGQALCIKAETHNTPTAVTPYFGQLTKLGGVLRDVLGTGLGADPIGCFEYTACATPETQSPLLEGPSPKHIALDTIRAIKEYGNTFGVPMAWSHMTFHDAYGAKPFALGGSIGILPVGAAAKGIPRPGDVVVLMGGLTGNEGIHGASASSAGSEMGQSSVQNGAPLEQVKFRFAIIEMRDAGCIRAITDLGAAGLNSAVGEIGEACGVWINTALVPLKMRNLPMWRILLSESQERMLLAVAPQHLRAVEDIAAKHFVRTAVIGRFTDLSRYTVFHDATMKVSDALNGPVSRRPSGDVGFDVPYSLLNYEPEQVARPPASSHDHQLTSFCDIQARISVDILPQIMADSEVASQEYASSQYDSTVQGHSTYGPWIGKGQYRMTSGYWATRPMPGLPYAAVLSTAFDPWLYEIDPARALRQSFARLLATQVLAGVSRTDICICDNFYTPHLRPDAGEKLVSLVDELANLVRVFGTPVISGKDSSSGSVNTLSGPVHVPSAVFLTALGKVSDSALLMGEEWAGAGNTLVKIGVRTPSVGGTVASRVLGLPATCIDDVDMPQVMNYLLVLEHSRSAFTSGSVMRPGGMAVNLILGSLTSRLGVTLVSNTLPSELYSEDRCCAIVEVPPEDVQSLPTELNPEMIGRLEERPGLWLDGRNLITREVVEAWRTSFEKRLS